MGYTSDGRGNLTWTPDVSVTAGTDSQQLQAIAIQPSACNTPNVTASTVKAQWLTSGGGYVLGGGAGAQQATGVWQQASQTISPIQSYVTSCQAYANAISQAIQALLQSIEPIPTEYISVSSSGGIIIRYPVMSSMTVLESGDVVHIMNDSNFAGVSSFTVMRGDTVLLHYDSGGRLMDNTVAEESPMLKHMMKMLDKLEAKDKELCR